MEQENLLSAHVLPYDFVIVVKVNFKSTSLYTGLTYLFLDQKNILRMSNSKIYERCKTNIHTISPLANSGTARKNDIYPYFEMNLKPMHEAIDGKNDTIEVTRIAGICFFVKEEIAQQKNAREQVAMNLTAYTNIANCKIVIEHDERFKKRSDMTGALAEVNV